MADQLVPILVSGLILLVAATLAWLAFRRKGLIPAGACSCGYPSTGIESGTCPECGKSISEEIERVEWKRRIGFFNRVVAWTAAVVVLAVPFTAAAIKLAGADERIACRTILIPKDGSFRSAILLWNVKPAPDPAPGSPRSVLHGSVRVELKSAADVTSVEAFTSSQDVAAWVERTIAANPGNPAAAELAQAVASAASGAEMILAGGSGSQFTMIASGTVSTVESPRWVPIVSIAAWILLFAWGVRAIARRVAGRA